MPYVLHIAPLIPAKKLINARERYAVPADEVAIAVIDTTVWGSAKTGLMFGAQGVYFTGSSATHAVPYSSFQQCELQVHNPPFVQFSPGVFFGTAGAPAVAKLLRQVRKFYEDWQQRPAVFLSRNVTYLRRGRQRIDPTDPAAPWRSLR